MRKVFTFSLSLTLNQGQFRPWFDLQSIVYIWWMYVLVSCLNVKIMILPKKYATRTILSANGATSRLLRVKLLKSGTPYFRVGMFPRRIVYFITVCCRARVAVYFNYFSILCMLPLVFMKQGIFGSSNDLEPFKFLEPLCCIPMTKW